MTFNDIVKVNQTLKTMDVKGKDYVQVNERIKAFRMLYPEGSIVTELVSNENGVCIIQATIMSNVGTVLATGMAYEKEGSTYINKTSYIENCETSAVGRALGMLGLGIDTSLASAEEVENAIINQPISKKDAAIIRAELARVGGKEEKLCQKYKVEKIEDLTEAQRQLVWADFNKYSKEK